MRKTETQQGVQPTDMGLEGQAVPHRILVVEDEPAMRMVNIKMLMDAGYKVDAAEDGAAAWDTLQSKSYDLLITDNNMPKVSGIELIGKVHAAKMALPVIMATGTVPELEFIRRPWLQPAALLVKPYTATEFLGTVKTVLLETSVPIAAR
jgi:DNA-binding response OmpR family regulator